MNSVDSFFQRTQLLTGEAGLEKLKVSRVTVVGLGGVGSHAAEALCRCGVGHISIVDPDRVEESNINRQLPALSSTIGQYKTEVMASRMLQINPDLDLDCFTCAYNEENSSTILGAGCDYLIDAIDSLPDKIHLIETCLSRDIPIISSMGTANRLNPLMLTIAGSPQCLQYFHALCFISLIHHRYKNIYFRWREQHFSFFFHRQQQAFQAQGKTNTG
jgi:tRNA A37 threonylcarbamoyladenosine dehydratase